MQRVRTCTSLQVSQVSGWFYQEIEILSSPAEMAEKHKYIKINVRKKQNKNQEHNLNPIVMCSPLGWRQWQAAGMQGGWSGVGHRRTGSVPAGAGWTAGGSGAAGPSRNAAESQVKASSPTNVYKTYRLNLNSIHWSKTPNPDRPTRNP